MPFKLIEIDKGNDLLRFESLLDKNEIAELSSAHHREGSEEHYLDFSQLSLGDFEGLVFDLHNDGFFERVETYGIRLVSVDNQKIFIPGYGYNDGYYSDKLTLVIRFKKYNGQNCETCETKEYDITYCQYNRYGDW